MATGASTADLAVILIDARKGVLTQSRRHTRIVAMMGIRHVLLAVNKMDLVGYEPAGLRRPSSTSYTAFAAQCGVDGVRPIPISALEGDNLIGAEPADVRGTTGPTVMHYLETVEAVGPAVDRTRSACRSSGSTGPARTSAASAAACASGAVHPGDRVRVLPSGVETQRRGDRHPGWDPQAAPRRATRSR